MVASRGVFSVYPKAHAGSEACTLLCCSGNSIPWDDDLLKKHMFFWTGEGWGEGSWDCYTTGN